MINLVKESDNVITDLIIQVLLGLGKGLLIFIPDFAIEGIDTLASWLSNVIDVIVMFFGSVGYFLPINLILLFTGFTLSVFFISLFWSITKAVIEIILLK